MKFKLEAIQDGVVVCQITEAMNREEALQIVKGLEKVLANGKARILVEFIPAAINAEGGPLFIEKALRPIKNLARKMKGDILYVVPGEIGNKVSGGYPTRNAALNKMLGHAANMTPEQQQKFLESENMKGQIEALKSENAFLEERVRELLELASYPRGEQEMNRILDHYKNLASQTEQNSPFGKGKAESDDSSL